MQRPALRAGTAVSVLSPFLLLLLMPPLLMKYDHLVIFGVGLYPLPRRPHPGSRQGWVRAVTDGFTPSAPYLAYGRR